MAERPADRAHPQRLQQPAVEALRSDADREICPEFLRKLRVYNSRPDLFAAPDLERLARTALEIEIVRNIEGGGGGENAIWKAFCQMNERYSHELSYTLIAEHHRLLRQHRREWDAFMASLPGRSWVSDIVAEL